MTNKEALAEFVREVADRKRLQYYFNTFGCKSVLEAIKKRYGERTGSYNGKRSIDTDTKQVIILANEETKQLVVTWKEIADMVVELLPEYDNRGNVQLNLFEVEEDEEGDYEDE